MRIDATKRTELNQNEINVGLFLLACLCLVYPGPSSEQDFPCHSSLYVTLPDTGNTPEHINYTKLEVSSLQSGSQAKGDPT